MQLITDMKGLCFLFLIVVTYSASAQNPGTDPLRWTLGQGTDLRNNQSFTYSGTLVTGGQSIQWIQASASSTFSVASVSGNWSDLGQNGQLVFTVEEEGASGLLTFERTANGLAVIMEFPKDDPQGSKVKWVVTNVVNNN